MSLGHQEKGSDNGYFPSFVRQDVPWLLLTSIRQWHTTLQQLNIWATIEDGFLVPESLVCWILFYLAHKEILLFAMQQHFWKMICICNAKLQSPCTLTRPPNKTPNLLEKLKKKKKKPSADTSYEIMNFLIILFSNCNFCMMSDNHREPFSAQDTQTTGFRWLTPKSF